MTLGNYDKPEIVEIFNPRPQIKTDQPMLIMSNCFSGLKPN